METLRNASVPDAIMGRSGGGVSIVDITVSDGRIASVRPHIPGPGRDLDGGLVLPAFVDIHTHIDKGHIWPRKPNPDGTFLGALFAVADDRQAKWSARDVATRMEFSLRAAYAHGTAALRTHIDSAGAQAEISWPVFVEMRDKWRGRIELQATCIIGPDELLDRAGLAATAKLMHRFGGNLGGAIASHPQSAAAMRNVVEAAGEHGLDLDLHCDETLDPSSNVLGDLAEAVAATGYTGKVLAGHCCSLAAMTEPDAQRTIERVAAAGIAIVSLPMCNAYLQDRADGRTPRMRGLTLVRELRAAGVPVAFASDNTRDPFYAYGDLDPLEVLREATRLSHVDHPQDDAWTWARSVGADAAHIVGTNYRARIEVGAPADLILFRARNWTELFARPQSDRVVLRNGVAIDTTLPDYRELDELMEA